MFFCLLLFKHNLRAGPQCEIRRIGGNCVCTSAIELNLYYNCTYFWGFVRVSVSKGRFRNLCHSAEPCAKFEQSTIWASHGRRARKFAISIQRSRVYACNLCAINYSQTLDGARIETVHTPTAHTIACSGRVIDNALRRLGADCAVCRCLQCEFH